MFSILLNTNINLDVKSKSMYEFEYYSSKSFHNIDVYVISDDIYKLYGNMQHVVEDEEDVVNDVKYIKYDEEVTHILN